MAHPARFELTTSAFGGSTREITVVRRAPPSTRATSVATVLSPQSKRWRPSTHKSPGSATGCTAYTGLSRTRLRSPLCCRRRASDGAPGQTWSRALVRRRADPGEALAGVLGVPGEDIRVGDRAE